MKGRGVGCGEGGDGDDSGDDVRVRVGVMSGVEGSGGVRSEWSGCGNAIWW